MGSNSRARSTSCLSRQFAALSRSGIRCTCDHRAAANANLGDGARLSRRASHSPSSLSPDGPRSSVARRPTLEEADAIRPGTALIALLQPAASAELLERLSDRGVTGLALERVPRITRAQSMDVLSSQATVAGYKAVLIGATALGKFLPML